MKDWIKKKLVMTPKRRIDAAYWLGTFQAILMMTLFQMLSEGEVLVAQWVGFILVELFLGYLYIKNGTAFQKETLWMTIKNPAKVTREEGTDIFGHPLVHPMALPPAGSRPPPPPRPPAPRSVRGPGRTPRP